MRETSPDSTSAFVRELDNAGSSLEGRPLIGGPQEFVSQVEWADSTTLYAVSDRTGWWNLYRVAVDAGDPQPLLRTDSEFGAPLWQLGARTFGLLSDGRLAVLHGVGSLQLGALDPSTGELVELEGSFDTWTASLGTDGTAVVGVAASPLDFPAVLQAHPRGGGASVVSPPTGGRCRNVEHPAGCALCATSRPLSRATREQP